MSQDLDLYSNGGQVVPVSPGGLDLYQTDAESRWGETPVDYLNTPGQQVANINDPQVQQNIAAIASVFETDMASLGFVQKDINKCISWFKQTLVNPVQRMPAKKHSYETWQFSHDPAFQAFCNYAATQRFPKELIQSVAFWLQQLEDFQHGTGRFAGQQVATPTTSSDPTDALSDADYARVLAANDQAQARTMGVLKDRWGSSFEANLRMVQTYFQSLPAHEQEHLSQFSTGWIKATNTVEVITSLYAQAIGANSLPSGGALATEIAEHERVMRYDRKRWNSDDQLQARYRELIRRRDGGR